MNPIWDGGPAFPMPNLDQRKFHENGMSLRDYFAAHAPAYPFEFGSGDFAAKIAEWRFEYADAMLAERERKQ